VYGYAARICFCNQECLHVVNENWNDPCSHLIQKANLFHIPFSTIASTASKHFYKDLYDFFSNLLHGRAIGGPYE
jgi:hypothetical protein